MSKANARGGGGDLQQLTPPRRSLPFASTLPLQGRVKTEYAAHANTQGESSLARNPAAKLRFLNHIRNDRPFTPLSHQVSETPPHRINRMVAPFWLRARHKQPQKRRLPGR